MPRTRHIMRMEPTRRSATPASPVDDEAIFTSTVAPWTAVQRDAAFIQACATLRQAVDARHARQMVKYHARREQDHRIPTFYEAFCKTLRDHPVSHSYTDAITDAMEQADIELTDSQDLLLEHEAWEMNRLEFIQRDSNLSSVTMKVNSFIDAEYSIWRQRYLVTIMPEAWKQHIFAQPHILLRCSQYEHLCRTEIQLKEECDGLDDESIPEELDALCTRNQIERDNVEAECAVVRVATVLLHETAAMLTETKLLRTLALRIPQELTEEIVGFACPYFEALMQAQKAINPSKKRKREDEACENSSNKRFSSLGS